MAREAVTAVEDDDEIQDFVRLPDGHRLVQTVVGALVLPVKRAAKTDEKIPAE